MLIKCFNYECECSNKSENPVNQFHNFNSICCKKIRRPRELRLRVNDEITIKIRSCRCKSYNNYNTSRDYAKANTNSGTGIPGQRSYPNLASSLGSKLLVTLFIISLSCIAFSNGASLELEPKSSISRSASSVSSASTLEGAQGKELKGTDATTVTAALPRFLYFKNPDHDPDTSSSLVATWFAYTSFTIMMAVFGTSFLIACAAVAVYYVLIVVTEPSQHGSVIGKSLDSKNEWSWRHAVQLIDLAYDTYSTFDLNDLECQEKILCELQLDLDVPQVDVDANVNTTDKSVMASHFMRKVSNVLLNLDLLSWVPHIKEYQNAIRVGQGQEQLLDDTSDNVVVTNSTTEHVDPVQDKQFYEPPWPCEHAYPTCRFSVLRFNTKYNALFA